MFTSLSIYKFNDDNSSFNRRLKVFINVWLLVHLLSFFIIARDEKNIKLIFRGLSCVSTNPIDKYLHENYRVH